MPAKKESKSKAILVRLLILAFSAYALYMLVGLHGQLSRDNAQLALLQKQAGELTTYNQQLSALLKGNDNQLIMQAIRDKTDYVYPNEQIYTDSAN